MRHHNFWVPRKGSVSPKRGTNRTKIEIFQFSRGEIPSNNEYSPNLKRNGWKLLQLWPTALSGTQNCPFPIGPFRRKIRNLGPYHLLDIITKEKPAKFQTKWTLASKVMRPRNFLGPKKGQPPKTGTNWLQIEILCFPSGDTLKSCVQSKFQIKRNGWKLLQLWPTALSGTPNCPISIGPSSNRNWKFAHCHILDIVMQNVPAKLQM